MSKVRNIRHNYRRILQSVCFIFLLKAFFESFLKDTGISFHIFVPILENESVTWIESLELCV